MTCRSCKEEKLLLHLSDILQDGFGDAVHVVQDSFVEGKNCKKTEMLIYRKQFAPRKKDFFFNCYIVFISCSNDILMINQTKLK